MGLRQVPHLAQKSPYVCPRCFLRAQAQKPRRLAQRRHFAQNSSRLQKSGDPALPIETATQPIWNKGTVEMKADQKKSVLSTLEQRGFVNQIVGYSQAPMME